MNRLTKLKIKFSGDMGVKSNSKDRIAATSSLGQKTNCGLPPICIVIYSCWKISFLERYAQYANHCATLMLRQTETSARAWIDVFFCASAMLPPDKRIVVSMEHGIPFTTIIPSSLATLSGIGDYTAVVANRRSAGKSISTYLNRLAQHSF